MDPVIESYERSQEEKRLTEAFVDLYYGICDGIYAGPLPETCGKDKPA